MLDFIVCTIPLFSSSLRSSFSAKKGKQNQAPRCRKLGVGHDSPFQCLLT